MSYPLLIDKMRRIVARLRDLKFDPNDRRVMFSGPDGVDANHGALWDKQSSYWGGYYYYFETNEWLMLELVYEYAAERPNPLGSQSWRSEHGQPGGYCAYVAARVGTDEDGNVVDQWSTDQFLSMNDAELVARLSNIAGVATTGQAANG